MIDWNALKARMDEATIGPWGVYQSNYGDGDAPADWCVMSETTTIDENHWRDKYVADTILRTADARFIASARTDIPEMYALLVEARETLLGLRHPVDEDDSCYSDCRPPSHRPECRRARDLIAKLPEAE